MKFQLKPRVQAPALDFEFSATPYIGRELWLAGLDRMHGWLAGYFEVGDAFPDYLFAETLKVHRCIADIWLSALRSKGMLSGFAFEKGNNLEVFAPGFIVLPYKGPRIELKVPKELIKFDPWEDRTLDAELPDAKYADYYIDKYFDVFVNEYYFATGCMRKRPNGKTFAPLDVSEHPRHALATKARLSLEAAPIEWRDTIDTLCEI